MKIQYFELTGTVQKIEDLVTIPRKSAPDIKKIVVTIETTDSQVLFPEVRNKKLHIIKDIKEGDYVKIKYSFQGSEKNNKKYNNIYLAAIERL